MRLRDDYIKDSSVGIKRWNRTINSFNIDFETKLPFEGFNRKIGTFLNAYIDPDGKVLNASSWEKNINDYLPSNDDNNYIVSLMKPVHEPGKFASWISPPDEGIDNKSGDFEYVKIHEA